MTRLRTIVAFKTLVGLALTLPLVHTGRAQSPATQDRLSLELVPADATIVVAIRPAEIAAIEDLRGAAKLIDQLLPFHVENVGSQDVREVMVIKYFLQSQRTVYRFVIPQAKTRFVEGLEKQCAMPRKASLDNPQFFQEVDETTVVVEQNAIQPSLKNTPPRWAEAWQARQDSPIVAAIDVRACLKSNAFPLDHLQGDFPLITLFSPLYFDTDWAVGGVSVASQPRLSAVAQSDDKHVTQIRDSLQALATVSQNALRLRERQIAARPVGDAPAMMTTLAKLNGELIKLLASAEFKVEGRRVNVAMQSPLSTKELGALAVATQPVVEQSRQARSRLISINNMKQLALGMLNYESVYKRFPAASTKLRGKSAVSKYPHSWRVSVLPFLEAQPQYDQYRFDEPWDSEANKKILANMPDVFRSPHDTDPNSTNTSYFVFTGPETLFAGEEGTPMRQVSDGTSNTILLVEAKRSVPWTKPEDLEYAADKPVPKLGGWVTGQFLAAMSDGSVRPVSTDIDEATLRAYITKAGGELVQGLPAPGGRQ